MTKWLVWAVVMATVGCNEVANPDYCDATSDCKNGFSCNPDTHGCEVIVDGGPDSGGSCVLDDECGSGVCRGDGSCELAENVLYVSPDGVSAGTCPTDQPCEIGYALSKTTASVSTIRLANGTYDLASDFVVDRDRPDVTIVGGRAAVLRRTAAGVVIDVRGVSSGVGPTLTLRGMTINKGLNCYWAGLRLENVLLDNAPAEAIPWVTTNVCVLVVKDSEMHDSPADGIKGDYSDLDMSESLVTNSLGFGISLTGSAGRGVVAIERSTISRSRKIGVQILNGTSFTLQRSLVSYNHLGGVESTGHVFDIANNFIVRNGGQGNTLGVDSSHFGGLHVAGSGASRVVFNTIAMNNSDPAANYAGGLYCDNATAASNVISSNQRGNEELPRAATGGNCNVSGSLIDQSIATADSKFVDFITDDFHLSAASPAVNIGSGVPEVTIDYDGDARSDGAFDYGADERL